MTTKCRGPRISRRRGRRVLAFAASFPLLFVSALGWAEAETLTARGNEPGWSVEISVSALSFRELGGETFIIEPAPQAESADGADRYSATVDGRSFELTIADEICVDTMSGMPHPKTATVVVGDRTLAGCAGEPASLLHGDWRVEEIGGTAVIAGSEPTLLFDPEGSINGNASCNRFFGRFSLTGEGLSISETGTSRMMCDQPLMDQERDLLTALEAVRGFEVVSPEHLRLLGDDGRAVISARR